MSDKKVLILIAVITVLALGGAIFALSKSSPAPKSTLAQDSSVKVETTETSFDFKDISYDGGKVEHAFPIKNNGSKDLIINNLQTSCMCTVAFLKTATETGPEFGMQGHGAATNGGWKGIIKPSEEGQIVIVFDPTAHGPQGVGPISRLVSFNTNDPDHPYIELSFSGNVVKK